jgi:c(7)-type cytochrome triheme protein
MAKEVRGDMVVRNWFETLLALCSVLFLVVALTSVGGLNAQQKVPEKLVFESKLGNVTFDHAKHQERVKGDCTACHDKFFPQAKAPLNFKAAMHKPAEAKKESCGGCHHEGGAAFASKGNCNNCHVKK